MIKKTSSLPSAASRTRCPWPGNDPLYIAYHDEEWGVPERDSRALYEKLILDGFQAGLSWITVLRKREAFRAAFDSFDPEKIARYDRREDRGLDAKYGHHPQPGENRKHRDFGPRFPENRGGRRLFNYLWGFFDGKSVQNTYRDVSEIPAQTPLSARIAKDLKSRGFNFCGPTVVYAFCQATGMVNDHLVSCWRHAECRAHASTRA